MEEQTNQWTTARLLQIADAYWQSCTLHAAVKLRIFTRLDNDRLTAEQVVESLGADRRGTTALLNALVAMGLLVHDRKDRYANSESAERYLHEQSPQYIGHIIMHHHHLVDGWAQLDRAVLEGGPVSRRTHGDERERQSFLMGMFNLAQAIAPKLAEQIDLAGRRHLLDLGGGPGTYAIHFCLANADLAATIYDLATTESFAMETVAKFDLAGRIGFQAGDFTTDEPIAGRYDVAWLSQILHSHGPDSCRRIIDKTVKALEPGGIIMVHEFFLNEDKDGPLFPALFSLNMLVNNAAGRSYSEEEVGDMLSRAGVGEIHRLPFVGPNDSYVICGKV